MTDDRADRDPEIRRRAAWLLGMLALVAALVVLVFVVFFNGNGGGDDNSDLAGPTAEPTVASGSNTPGTTGATSPDDPASDSSGSTPTDTTAGSGSPTDTASGTSAPGQKVSCPSADTCTFDSDIGNAVAAINDYREKNDKPKIPGIVSAAATKCAKSNGEDCKGSWASTFLSPTDGRADGAKAVDKIKSLGKLLSDMASVEVGWAYDPGSKMLYFAIVRQT